MNHRRMALVTGGAKRVGRAIVERLAEAGYAVAFTYNGSESEANALLQTLEEAGHQATCAKFDLAHESSAEAIAIWAYRWWGGIDVLVNNASVYVPDDEKYGATAELSRRLMQVNALTPARLITELAPCLDEDYGACVINMIDLLADRPWPKYSAYCASKAALKNLTISMARKLAPKVRVNGIAPGVVDWPEDMPESAREEYLAKVPLRRAGTPQDVANLVHYLVTEGTYITGEIIRLDGGRGIV